MERKIKPVEKQSAVEIATELIIDFLQSGELGIGDKLPPESTMSKSLNVSRSTMREAYRHLQSLGYLEIINGKGAFVKNCDQNMFQDALNWFKQHNAKMSEYLQVRLSLDPLTAQLAAQNCTPEDAEILNNIQDQFEAAFKKKNYMAMAELDAEFHEKLVLMTNNELLVALIKIVNYYFQFLRQTSFKIEEHGYNAIEPHRKIIEGVATQDEHLAAIASIDHILASYEALCGTPYPHPITYPEHT